MIIYRVNYLVTYRTNINIDVKNIYFRGPKMVSITRILSLFVTLFIFLSFSSILIGTSATAATTNDLTFIPDQENAPEWEVGDEWVMGFKEDIDEGDLIASMPPDERFMMEYVNIDFDLTAGVYESLKVMETGVDVNEYTCYGTYFEAYYALAAGFDINMNIDEDDYQEIMQKTMEYEEDYYDDEEYWEEDSGSMYDDIAITIMGYYKGTVWVEADLTGDVYFTEDDHAVAKEVMEYHCNADIVYNFRLDVHLEESYMSIDMEMLGSVNLKMEDVKIDFIKEYDPPVDIFEYPLDEYDYWYGDSSTTFEITDASGTITYDVKLKAESNMDEDENIDEEGVIYLSKEMFDDTEYEYELEFSGDSYDTEYVENLDGEKEKCTVIEFDAYSYGGYDYWDYDEDGPGGIVEYKEESSEDELLGDFSDAGTFSEIGYVNMLSGGDFYDSENEGYVIQEDLMGLEGVGMNDGTVTEMAMPIGAGGMFLDGDELTDDEVADLTLRPKEYRELSEFRDGGREDIRSTFNDYKREYGKDDQGSVMENGLIYSIIAVIVIIVLVIIAAKIVIRRSKGKRVAQAPTQPLTYPEYQTRYYNAASNIGQPNQPAVQGMSPYPQSPPAPVYNPAPVPAYSQQSSPPHYFTPPPPPPPPPPAYRPPYYPPQY